jgi:rhodanese-related sulfurtransferase
MFSVIVLGSVLLSLLVSSLPKQSNHYILGHWSINECSATDFSRSLSSTLIVDARTSADYQNGHIPDALSLNLERWDDSFVDFLTAWSPERSVVVYCGGQACGLSKEVALRILSDLPDAKVFVLKGGYPAWQAYQAQKSSSAL